MLDTRTIVVHWGTGKRKEYETYVFVPHIMGLKRNREYDPLVGCSYTDIILTNNHNMGVAETVEEILKLIADA